MAVSIEDVSFCAVSPVFHIITGQLFIKTCCCLSLIPQLLDWIWLMLLGNESGSLINNTRDICNKIRHMVLHSHHSADFLLN